ncbi:GyrI-like domain-containing protein [Cohnella candidum]|uniref:AraC family transcriptional regulator n=1 Tax=Cohnella candidum TaxID=2674991 RepID=A0A3G3K076_9BACL|nr:GyrI-like domain-containing protein [Cohnella candidum]AYQ73792.1 AraC family transcriptional regulator [Cohnella candidum]
MSVEIVERPTLLAAVIQVPRDGAKVREAWKQVEVLLADHPAVADRENGLVFIPEWQWKTGVETLWVGVEIRDAEGLPQGLQTVSLPARTYARIRVRGDKQRMWETYEELSAWFRSGPYERDTEEGSLGFESNPLHPVNPFDIPADEINDFHFDIYAPIKQP